MIEQKKEEARIQKEQEIARQKKTDHEAYLKLEAQAATYSIKRVLDLRNSEINAKTIANYDKLLDKMSVDSFLVYYQKNKDFKIHAHKQYTSNDLIERLNTSAIYLEKAEFEKAKAQGIDAVKKYILKYGGCSFENPNQLDAFYWLKNKKEIVRGIPGNEDRELFYLVQHRPGMGGDLLFNNDGKLLGVISYMLTTKGVVGKTKKGYVYVPLYAGKLKRSLSWTSDSLKLPEDWLKTQYTRRAPIGYRTDQYSFTEMGRTYTKEGVSKDYGRGYVTIRKYVRVSTFYYGYCVHDLVYKMKLEGNIYYFDKYGDFALKVAETAKNIQSYNKIDSTGIKNLQQDLFFKEALEKKYMALIRYMEVTKKPIKIRVSAPK